MRYIKFATSVIVICLFIGCSSVITNLVTDQATYNWFYIPENAKVGDVAYHRSLEYDQEYKIEITELDQTGYRLEVTYIKAPFLISGMENMRWKFLVDRRGFVQSARLVHNKSGKETPLKVASHFGEFGFVKEPRLMELSTPEKIETPAGTFDVRHIVVYESSQRAPLGATINMTVVNFVHPDAKLGLVKQTFSSKDDVPILEVVNFVNGISPYNLVYNRLIDFMISKAKASTQDQNYITGFELIRME